MGRTTWMKGEENVYICRGQSCVCAESAFTPSFRCLLFKLGDRAISSVCVSLRQRRTRCSHTPAAVSIRWLRLCSITRNDCSTIFNHFHTSHMFPMNLWLHATRTPTVHKLYSPMPIFLFDSLKQQYYLLPHEKRHNLTTKDEGTVV
jgi:hypothetical protein